MANKRRGKNFYRKAERAKKLCVIASAKAPKVKWWKRRRSSRRRIDCCCTEEWRSEDETKCGTLLFYGFMFG
jgi:hypothetical protein